MTTVANARDWCRRIILGPAGLHAFEEHEIGFAGPDHRDVEVALFVLRCLANPECEGSADVLAALAEHSTAVVRR